jgi:type I restriction enzyme S subunit
MSFPRYPEYKESGVEWLGVVPGHWEVWKLSHSFAQIGSGTTPKTDNREYYDNGAIPWVNTGDLNDGTLEECEKRITALAINDHSSLKTYPPGSLLIAMYGATIGKLAILNFSATVNQACCVFAGKSEIASKFMFYWFLGLRQQIISLATGGGQPNISQDILRSLRVASPPLPEQTQIAAFLDRETAKIDALVAEQRRLMALLKEKRQALITHAVTKGLDPNVKMKPSGVDWIGDVPDHWGVKSIGYILDAVGDVDHFMPESVEKGVPYLMTGDLKELVSQVNLEDCKQVSHSDYAKLSKRIKSTKGDVILARYATIGTSMYVDIDIEFLVSYSCVTIKTTPSKVSGLYLFEYLKSDVFYQGISNQINTNTQGNVGISDLRKLCITHHEMC